MELENLIEKVKQHDQAAFEELYNQYYQMGFSLALQFVKNEDDAMDIIQDAFITICNKIDTLDNPERFKSWYMQIVANRCKDFLKKKNPMSFTDINAYDEDGNLQFDIEDDDRDFQPEEAVDYTETVNIVKTMLEELPEEQKMCLLLYYVNGLKISEISESLGVSEATIKSRLKYGKEKLKVQVIDYEKKNGVKLHSFAGFAIIPFIKWMFNNSQGIGTAAPSSILKTCLNTLGGGVTAQTGASVGQAAFSFTKIIDTFKGFSLGKKIASIAVASTIVVGSAVGVSTIARKDTEEYDYDKPYYGESYYNGSEDVDYTFNMEDCVKITFSGIEGLGRAELKYISSPTREITESENVYNFVEKIIEKTGDENISKYEYSYLGDLLQVKIDKDKKLSSGEKVTLKVYTVEKLAKHGIDLKYIKEYFHINFKEEIVYTVGELLNYEELDLMNGLEKYITYSGGNGGGVAEIDIPVGEVYHYEDLYFVKYEQQFSILGDNEITVVQDNKRIGTFVIELYDNKNLTEGSVIRIGISSVSYLNFDEKTIQKELHKKGKHLSMAEYEVTVPNLGEYIKVGEGVSASTFAQIKKLVESKPKDGCKALEYYMAALKPTATGKNPERLQIKFLYRCPGILDINYSVGTVSDIVIKPDGSVWCVFKYDGSYRKTKDEAMDVCKTSYTLQKIK